MHCHVGSLRAMRALHQLKFDHIALVQVAISLSDNRCVVDKDVRAPTALDKTDPFSRLNHITLPIIPFVPRIICRPRTMENQVSGTSKIDTTCKKDHARISGVGGASCS